MNNQHPPPRDDHDDWLDLLAGHDVPEADPKTRHEAELLRAAILADRKDDELTPEELEHSWQRLRFRLNREGILGPRKKPLWQQPGILTALAATLAAVLILPPILPRFYAPDLEPKSFIVPQTVTTAEPEPRARALVQALRTAGLSAQIQALESGWRVSAELPNPVPDALQETLKPFSLALPPPNQRQLQVLFLPAEP